MSREVLDTAVKLLAKAQSTPSEHEAIALVERSYGLLAQVINAYDAAHDAGPRRRERRRLLERRRRPRTDADELAPAPLVSAADARDRYGAEDGPVGRRRRIDVVL